MKLPGAAPRVPLRATQASRSDRAERQRLEQQAVNHAEHRDVGADAETQHENRDDRERRLAAKLTERVPDVEDEALDRRPLPGLAAALFQRRDVAELTAGRRGRLLTGHAGRHEGLDFFVEMLPDFLRQVAIHPSAREDPLDPVHDSPQDSTGSTGASTRRMPSSIRSKLEVSRCRWRAPAGVRV